MTANEPIGHRPNTIPGVEAIDLRHYWRVLMRFKFGIFALGGITAVLTALVVMGQDDVYDSTASLLIESSQAQITSIEQLYGIDSQQQEYFATQHEMLKNRTLAEKVINELALVGHPEFAPEAESEGLMVKVKEMIPAQVQTVLDRITSRRNDGAVNYTEFGDPDAVQMAKVLDQFSKRLTVEPVRNTQVVKITFEANDPILAATVANSLADAYIQDNLDQRLDATQTANIWLTERLESLRLTLEESEMKLQEYLEQEQLIDIEGVSSLNVQELDELTTQSIEARRRSAEAEAIYRQVQQIQGRETGQLMTIPAILNHPTIQGLRDEMDRILGETAELSKRYGRNHPRMIGLASQRSAAEDNLSRQVQQVFASIENEYLAAQQNELSTMGRLDQSKASLQNINRNNFALQELEREVETNRQLYDMFFTRVRETDETDSFQSTNAVIVDPAVPSIYPSKPRRSLIVMIAAVAGLFLGIFLAFLREMLDNTIKVPADVEERLHAPMLGVVPYVKTRQSSKDKDLAFLGFYHEKGSAFAESLRTIRTGIALTSIDTPHQTIAVTSSVTNEGKSTVAVNLAIAMGQVEGQTLLIDADMRRPSIAKSIGLESNARGLSNLVAEGIKSKDSCIHFWQEGGISVLPAGQYAPNPLEMISSKTFKEILEQLKGLYSTIIIDTPPVNAVSDSLIIAPMVDAVTYVVRADSTPVNSIRSGIARVRSGKDNLIGVVLSQVNAKKQSYYGEGDYYGGYYDSQGYGNAPVAVANG